MHLRWRLQIFRVISASFFLLILLPLRAEPTLGAELLPEVKKAMQYGLAAAKQREWRLAIKHFRKAQNAAPVSRNSPDVLFNLALAYDNAGGAELLSIVWFHAYLASASDAAKEKLVRQRIIELEIKVEAITNKLFASTIAAANQIPNFWRWGSAKIGIIQLYAEMGDFDGAKRKANLGGDKHITYQVISKIQAESGDFEGAKYTASMTLAPGEPALPLIGSES